MKRSIIGATQTLKVNNHYVNAYFGVDMDKTEKPYFLVVWVEGDMVETDFASRKECENAYSNTIQTLLYLKD